MKLNDLCPTIDSTVEILAIHDDSRKVDTGSLFVALSGLSTDGAQFIDQAVENGAVAIAYDKDKSVEKKHDVVYIPVDSSKEFLREAARRFYGNPSGVLSVIGVTGTNGKTTTTYLIENLLSCVQQQCGVIGTIHHRIGEQVWSSNNTTPGFLENQKMLQAMVDEGCQGCVMEVSSHALDQGRVDGIDFSGAVFTNLSGDHLDYHGTMEAYFNAKAKLFHDLSPEAWAVINVDDEYGLQLSSESPGQVMTFGIDNKADVMVEILEQNIHGMRLLFSCVQGQIELETSLIGEYNAYNLLATVATGLAMGLTLEDIQTGLEVGVAVPGRLEKIEVGQAYSVFIDYAHTHDGLENVLLAFRPIKTQRVITVFGCGGDRDRSKRPKMGAVATRLSDHVIITSDNPRSEDPQSIIEDIAFGVEQENYEVVLDRREAIQKALSMAQPNDIVLVAGKGHETCQILKDQTIEFDERKIIQELINSK